MSTDERNFRSAYYEKVGFRNVEERKSLEILLKEKPVDPIKLKQFCLRFTVPAVHRSLLWNLLLNIYPIYSDPEKYVIKQREAVYNDLLHALNVMRIVDKKTPKQKILYAMWLLETKQLYIGCNINNDNNFATITEALLQTFENEVELYWIAKHFYELTEGIQRDLPTLTVLSFTLLEKKDELLYRYLEQKKLLEKLPLQKWYTTCFSGVLRESALIRIWDKICGGSIKILVFVFLILMSTLRRNIMDCKDIDAILETIHKMDTRGDQETADLIVNKSIELWQQDKGHSEFLIHHRRET